MAHMVCYSSTGEYRAWLSERDLLELPSARPNGGLTWRCEDAADDVIIMQRGQRVPLHLRPKVQC